MKKETPKPELIEATAKVNVEAVVIKSESSNGAVARKVEYSDGKDYSHLKPNTDKYPEHNECVFCGSNNVTITDDKDICHNCGYVYT